jgi:hypothetical protein
METTDEVTPKNEKRDEIDREFYTEDGGEG